MGVFFLSGGGGVRGETPLSTDCAEVSSAFGTTFCRVFHNVRGTAARSRPLWGGAMTKVAALLPLQIVAKGLAPPPSQHRVCQWAVLG